MKIHKTKKQARVMSEDALGEISAKAMDVLSEAISKGRDMKEQISLIESLTAQVEEVSEDQKTSSAGQKENKRFVLKTKQLMRQLRRRVYECLVFLVSIDEIAEIFCEDDKRMLQELRKNWPQWYKNDFDDCELTTTKLTPALAAGYLIGSICPTSKEA